MFVPADTASVAWTRDARRLVRTVLRAHQALAHADDAELIVAELVANGARHAQAPYRLLVRCDGRDLHVEVADHSPGSVPQDGSGYGWTIVRALSTRHGVLFVAGQKRVWAELRLAPVRRLPNHTTRRVHSFG